MTRYFLLHLSLISAVFIGCRTNETPKAQVDDLKITAQAKSKLANDVGLSSITDISINSTNGVVTLSGQVDSAETRQKAVAIVKAIPEVVRVVDNLQVAGKQSGLLGEPGSRSGVVRAAQPVAKRI
jgi:hypothetical protein